VNFSKIYAGLIMSKPIALTLLPYGTARVILLFLLFFSKAALLAAPAANPPLSATQYAFNELIKAGWHIDVAKAVVAVNSGWFTTLKQESENDFHIQIQLLQQLDNEAVVSQFLRKYPETAGLLAFSDDPAELAKKLDKPACYGILTSFYALHTTPTNIQLLTEALEKHRERMCQLGGRGILGAETVFIFPRNTYCAQEYDAWLEEVFSKYIRHSDKQLAEIMGFLIKQGKGIRLRLNKNNFFCNGFRKKLWPALMRVVDNNGEFELLSNEAHIWDLLALKEGEMLLNKWGLGPIVLLFGDNSYPADMRPIIIQILLQGDDETVEALFKYKDVPLFRDLMRRPLSASTQAALANQLARVCHFDQEQTCPDLSNRLHYYASLTNDAALAEEVGPPPNGAVTWIPFHGSYYAIKKMTQGREINGEDMLNLGLDALALVPAAVLAYPFAQMARPLTHEIVLDVGIIGIEVLAFTPRTYHVVKPLGKFAIQAGNSTGKMLAQQFAEEIIQQQTFKHKKITLPNVILPVTASIKQSQYLFSQIRQKNHRRVLLDVTKPIQFIHEKVGRKGRNAPRFVEFEARIIMRNDAKMIINLTNGLGSEFFRKTAQNALSEQTGQLSGQNVSAWQQNISAWWLMNAEIEN